MKAPAFVQNMNRKQRRSLYTILAAAALFVTPPMGIARRMF